MADAEDDGGGSMGSGRARELLINGLSMNAAEVEAKLDEGNIQEAETSLREGLSLNYEEARALLGRLEYQRGNVEAALRVFDGVDLQAAIQRLQPSPEKPPSRRSRSHGESLHAAPQHAATLVLEAIFLKSMSLQKLGMATEAAEQCNSVLDAAEKLIQNGPDTLLDNKLQETISKAVEFLPELWKQAGQDNEVLVSYRRALLNQWNIDEECCARIQKRYAVFLLYSGVETGPPNSATQADGSFIPKNNFEEAVLLLMILLRKWLLGKIQRDPSVMEHFTFALSLCGQTNVLARHFEEVLPGVYPRCDRWYSLALCYSAAGDNKAALNLLRKSLNKHESPNDIPALLLAAKICSEDCYLASEGVEHARKAVANVQGGVDEHLKSVGLHLLGTCLGKQAKVASSDQERSHLRTEALKSLDEAITVEQDNPDLIFDLGLEYAEQHNMNAALRCAKGFIDATGGSLLKGWRFLALVLSSQQRYSEAEVVTDAAFDETSKWEQGPLLRIKAKLKAAQSLPMDAVEAYRFLLALVQAQRKTAGSLKSSTQVKDDKADEFEVWQGLGNLYSSLSRWRDAEICLEKARALKPYSAATLHTEGFIREAQGQSQEALGIYSNALSTDPDHVLCKVSLGALLWKRGSKSLPVARCFLSDALRLEPTNRLAWYYLGMVHRDDGRIAEAADCFQAASMLEESDPIESFILIS